MTATRRIDSYSLEQIDEDKINKIIEGMDPEKSFLFFLENFANRRGEPAENLTNETLTETIEETFKRLSYGLYYQLREAGETVSMPSLVLLLAHLNDIYDQHISEAPSFADIVDWDTQLSLMFEILSNFHSPSQDLVGIQYLEVEAIESAVSQEDAEAAQARITAIIDTIRTRFFQTTADPDRQELFEIISIGMAKHFIELRTVFNNPEKLIENLVDEVVEFLEEKYENNQDVLANEQIIRQIIPEKFAHYSQLLANHSQKAAKFINYTFEIEVQPNPQAIWNAIVTIALDSVKDLPEENPDEIIPQELFALPGSERSKKPSAPN